MNEEAINAQRLEAERKINEAIKELNEKLPNYLVCSEVKQERDCSYWRWRIKISMK